MAELIDGGAGSTPGHGTGLMERLRERHETAVRGFKEATRRYNDEVDQRQLQRLTQLKAELQLGHEGVDGLLQAEHERVVQHREVLRVQRYVLFAKEVVGATTAPSDVVGSAATATASGTLTRSGDGDDGAAEAAAADGAYGDLDETRRGAGPERDDGSGGGSGGGAPEDDPAAMLRRLEQWGYVVLDGAFVDAFHSSHDETLRPSRERMLRRRQALLRVAGELRSGYVERCAMIDRCEADIRAVEAERLSTLSASMEALLLKLSSIAYMGVGETQVLVHRVIHSVNEQLIENTAATSALLTKLRQWELMKQRGYSERISVVYADTLAVMQESSLLWAAQLLMTKAFRRPVARSDLLLRAQQILSAAKAETTNALGGLRALQDTLQQVREPSETIYPETCGGTVVPHGWLRGYNDDVSQNVFRESPLSVAEEWQAMLGVLVRNAQVKAQFFLQNVHTHEAELTARAAQVGEDLVDLAHWIHTPYPAADAAEELGEVEAWCAASLDPADIDEVFLRFVVSPTGESPGSTTGAVTLPPLVAPDAAVSVPPQPSAGDVVLLQHRREQHARRKAISLRRALAEATQSMQLGRALIDVESAWFSEMITTTVHDQIRRLHAALVSTPGCVRFTVEDSSHALEVAAVTILGTAREYYVALRHARLDYEDHVKWLEGDLETATSALHQAGTPEAATELCRRGLELLDQIKERHTEFHLATLRTMREMLEATAGRTEQAVAGLMRQLGVEDLAVVIQRQKSAAAAAAAASAAAAAAEVERRAREEAGERGTKGAPAAHNAKRAGDGRQAKRGEESARRSRVSVSSSSSAAADSAEVAGADLPRSLDECTTFTVPSLNREMCVIGALTLGQRSADLYPSAIASLELVTVASCEKSSVPDGGGAGAVSKPPSILGPQRERPFAQSDGAAAQALIVPVVGSGGDLVAYVVEKVLDALLPQAPGDVAKSPGTSTLPAIAAGGKTAGRVAAARAGRPGPASAASASGAGGGKRRWDEPVDHAHEFAERLRVAFHVCLAHSATTFAKEQVPVFAMLFSEETTVPLSEVRSWRDELQACLTSWLLQLQMNARDNVAAFFAAQKAALEIATNEVMRQHRRRAPALQSHVYETRLRRLEDNAAVMDRHLLLLRSHAERLSDHWGSYAALCEEELRLASPGGAASQPAVGKADGPSSHEATAAGPHRPCVAAGGAVPAMKASGPVPATSRLEKLSAIVEAASRAQSLSALEINAKAFRVALAAFMEDVEKREAAETAELHRQLEAVQNECEQFTQERIQALVDNGTISSDEAPHIVKSVRAVIDGARETYRGIVETRLPAIQAAREARHAELIAQYEAVHERNREELVLLATLQRSVVQMKTNVHNQIMASTRSQDSIDELLSELEALVAQCVPQPQLSATRTVDVIDRIRNMQFDVGSEPRVVPAAREEASHAEGVVAFDEQAERDRVDRVHWEALRSITQLLRTSSTSQAIGKLDELRQRLYQRGRYLNCLAYKVELWNVPGETAVEPRRLSPADHEEVLASFVATQLKSGRVKKRLPNTRKGAAGGAGAGSGSAGPSTSYTAAAALAAMGSAGFDGSTVLRAVVLGVQEDAPQLVPQAPVTCAEVEAHRWLQSAKAQITDAVRAYVAKNPGVTLAQLSQRRRLSVPSDVSVEVAGGGSDEEQLIGSFLRQCHAQLVRSAAHVRDAVLRYRVQVQRAHILLDSMPAFLLHTLHDASLVALQLRLHGVWNVFEASYVELARRRQHHRGSLKTALSNAANVGILQRLANGEEVRSRACEVQVKMAQGGVLFELEDEAMCVALRCVTVTSSFFTILRGFVTPEHLVPGEEAVAGHHRGLRRLLDLRAREGMLLDQPGPAAMRHGRPTSSSQATVTGVAPPGVVGTGAGAAAAAVSPAANSAAGTGSKKDRQQQQQQQQQGGAAGGRERSKSTLPGASAGGAASGQREGRAPADVLDERDPDDYLPLLARPSREYPGIALRTTHPLESFRREQPAYVPAAAAATSFAPALPMDVLAPQAGDGAAGNTASKTGSQRTGVSIGATASKPRVAGGGNAGGSVGSGGATGAGALAGESGGIAAELQALLSVSPAVTAPVSRAHELTITFVHRTAEQLIRCISAAVDVANVKMGGLLVAEAKWRESWREAVAFLRTGALP